MLIRGLIENEGKIELPVTLYTRKETPKFIQLASE